MARTPKPLRRWRKKVMRSLNGKHRTQFNRDGSQRYVDSSLRPRNLRIYR